MINKKLATLLAAGALVAGALQAQAASINGSIGFFGTYTQNGGTIGDLTTATSMTITSVSVGIATDDLAGAGAPLSFANPIGVNGNPPAITQLWSVTVGADTYTFDVVTSAQVFTDDEQINLQGSGTMKRNGADDTLGAWQLGFGRTGAAFTWQSTSATGVPDGGATAMLLGLGVLGMATLRRKLS